MAKMKSSQDELAQPRSQGLSSSRPIGTGRRETLGTRLELAVISCLAENFTNWI